jgi:hypothetical protein
MLALDEPDTGHDQARDAVAALAGVLVAERPLERARRRVRRTARLQFLDGGDLTTVGPDRRRQAGFTTIEMSSSAIAGPWSRRCR